MPTGELHTQLYYTAEELVEMLKVSPAPTAWYSPVSQSVVSASMSEDTGKPKFNVGDIVVGNFGASMQYFVTKEGWKGVVTKVDKNRFTAVGLNNEKNSQFSAADMNGKYELDYQYFERIGSVTA